MIVRLPSALPYKYHTISLNFLASCLSRGIAYIAAMTFRAKDSFFHDSATPPVAVANFALGDVVRHRIFAFRGVVFDIDPVFANSDEWYESIPEEVRPAKEQPYYHLFAENDDSSYVAYVSQQNLIGDPQGGPVSHPAIGDMFLDYANGRYDLKRQLKN